MPNVDLYILLLRVVTESNFLYCMMYAAVNRESCSAPSFFIVDKL